ncbi:MAG: FliM/FliN family flagellar motor switch protein [SAR324 cluster bacterium]|nr:FliM/FliN family flagellar motor switch protein [SAR324 cluster bacterium]
MAEISDDYEIKLSAEDSPGDILNDLGDIELLEEEHSGDESLAGLDDADLDDADLDDVLSESVDLDDASDEGEIDLGMDEIGDLVEDLKLDVAGDDIDASVEGEADMVFDEEETEDDSNDSVESLLDELGDDDSGELSLAADSAGEEGFVDLEEVNETAVEESSETDAEKVSAETESTEKVEGSTGNDSGDSESSDVLDMLHDPDISDDTADEDTEDMELGMDTLDDTKDDDLNDLGLDDTETVESGNEDVAVEDVVDESEEVDVTDATTEDEIMDLGIDDVETAEAEPEADESATETAEVEPEAEEIPALETTSDTQGELEELSEEKEEIEIEEPEIEVQETPAIDIVEIVMPIESDAAETIAAPLGSDMLLNFNHEVVVEIARTSLTGEEITQITYGSIIELDKVAGEPVNLVLDGKTIALGEVVQINNEKLGIRIVGVIQD